MNVAAATFVIAHTHTIIHTCAFEMANRNDYIAARVLI